MFADPQTVTLNAVANTLPRIIAGVNSGGFQTSDAASVLTISHNYATKRTRRAVKLVFSKISADPLITSQNVQNSMSVYLVVDTPKTAFSIAEQKIVVDGLTLWLTTSTGANVTKLLGGES